MREQMNLKEVVINTQRQNCYVAGTRTAIQDTIKKVPEKKYVSLERKNLPNGFIETLEEKDYPINSDSVTSYADGADYRTDPLQAIANAPKRVNLGDVTEVQNFIESDPQNAVRVFRDVVAKLKAQQSTQPAETAQPAPAENGGETK